MILFRSNMYPCFVGMKLRFAILLSSSLLFKFLVSRVSCFLALRAQLISDFSSFHESLLDHEVRLHLDFSFQNER